ncbi:MAG: hypothetical protein WA700_19685 [Acidobacteriaceae bacterium]
MLDWKQEFGRTLSARKQTEPEKEYLKNRVVMELDDEDEQDATRETKLKFSSELEELSLNHVESTDIL